MRIESAEVTIEANSNYSFEHKQTSSFSSHLINAKLDVKDDIRKQNLVKLETTKLEKILLNSEKDLNHQDRIKKNILETLLRNFTDDKEFKLHPNDQDIKNPKISKLTQVKLTTIENTHEYFQKSSLEYNTQAFVKTNRGQINIDLELSFSQEFYEVHKSKITSKKTIYLDPLIINYNSNLSSFDNISDSMKFTFDLNSDGKDELIPNLKNGSGFLTLDKNHNKTIDNGNELFGANTNDGFEELREFDEDENSWIDENDSIFKDLLIWEKNENGDNSLISLGQAGVGAIYLSAVDSGFTYSSGIRDDYARLKEASFYLKEDGKAGLVTSVEFAT